MIDAPATPPAAPRYRLGTFGTLVLLGPGNETILGRHGHHRRRLALLAVLAVAGARGRTRDQLLALFWPETTQARARHSLDQLLYALRTLLGETLFESGDPVRLNRALLESDIGEFDAALVRGDLEAAVALYRGPFLDGFHLGDALDFERWLDSERARLERRYTDALERLAARADSASDHDAAVRWRHLLVETDPLSGRNAAGLIRALRNAGDHSAALRYAERYEALVAQELGTTLGPEAAIVIAELRGGTTTAPAATPRSTHRRSDARPTPGSMPRTLRPTDAMTSPEPTTLPRRFGLLPATALNMTNMMGAGPFITIPLLMTALGGPQAMLGWLVALVIVICDGMVWSELGAAMPGSGGSFQYLREAFGRERFGRLMGFLFVWQFVLSGPLEIASGYIGFAAYARYIWSGLGRGEAIALIVGIGVLNVALLYRRIHAIARITVSLWVGTLITVLAVIGTGAMNFDPRLAFDFPPGAFDFSLGFFLGLGAASRVGVYDYLGYYDVCYIGDEVRDPGRVIPRSILISTAAVALIYIGINLSIIGVIPWREFVPAEAHPESGFIVSTLMERVYGSRVATVFTLLILWTAFGSVFALLLGYSRIPFAAAQSGYFFRAFGRLHPTGQFPYVSLLVLGALSIVAGFFSLGTVIDAMIVTRIIVQFMGQIVGLMLLRKRAPDMPRPYRMWLYPLPAIVALIGWIFLFATTPVRVILFGVGMLALGCVVFLLWSWRTERWPFVAAVSR